ncbi:AAA family ATPase [Cypionkella sp.]|uniref:AAA family ATPase n=1 Tax=Cypionkella sp. TaxID=2811411 RepID=UPI0026074A1C|nr:AAA family ATPase [Cypionkella sp.]
MDARIAAQCPGDASRQGGATRAQGSPDFWPIWRGICTAAQPLPITSVFGSEPYVVRLAAELGATPVLIDPDRLAFPVSATAIRTNPAAHWRFVPGPIRALYQKRVVLFGAESVGKSTMTRALAAHFDTLFVPEYGRTHDAFKPDLAWSEADFTMIAAGHRAMRAAIAPQAGAILFEDTDPLLTSVWQEYLLGGPAGPAKISDPADLYLLLDTDMPWINDGTRYQADTDHRCAFHRRCLEVLADVGANVCVVSGAPQERWQTCLSAISALTDPPQAHARA